VYLYKTLTLDEGKTALDAMTEVVGGIRKIPVDDSLNILEIAVEGGLTFYDARAPKNKDGADRNASEKGARGLYGAAECVYRLIYVLQLSVGRC